MIDLNAARLAGKGVLMSLRKYRLIIACALVMVCFLLCDDLYAAGRFEQKTRKVGGKKRERVIDMSTQVKQKMFDQTFRSDLAPRYLVEPKGKNSSMLVQLAADTCGVTSSSIISIPFTDSTSTTVGATDNYDVAGNNDSAYLIGSGDTCPAGFTCDNAACFNDCNAYGGNLDIDRGYAYLGTGTGLDVAYQISFLNPTNFQITLDPTDSDNAGTPCDPVNGVYAGCESDDLSLTLYGSVCTNNASDVVVIADNSAHGNAGDNPDNSEVITVLSAPAGTYNIVVDGYSYSNAPAPTAGPFTLSITCAPSMSCPQPGAFRRPRR